MNSNGFWVYCWWIVCMMWNNDYLVNRVIEFWIYHLPIKPFVCRHILRLVHSLSRQMMMVPFNQVITNAHKITWRTEWIMVFMVMLNYANIVFERTTKTLTVNGNSRCYHLRNIDGADHQKHIRFRLKRCKYLLHWHNNLSFHLLEKNNN